MLPRFLGGRGLLGPNPVNSEGQGTPWMSRQLIAGLLLMVEAAGEHKEHFCGAVSCSRILRHAAQFRPRGAGIRTGNLPITSPPALPVIQIAYYIVL